MSKNLENTEDIMDDTSIKSKANSKEDEEYDHIKLLEDLQIEQFSIENANEVVLSTSNETITTSTSTNMSTNVKQLHCTVHSDTDSDIALKSESKDVGRLPWSDEHSGRSSSLHRAAAAARLSFLKLYSPGVSSIITKNEDIIESNTNEENKERCGGILQEDANSEHSALEKEQNVSTIDKENLTLSEKITSKSIPTTPKQLLCSKNSCSDSVTEVVFKGESKDVSSIKTKDEDIIGSNTNEENKERCDGIIEEDTNSEHPALEKEQNVSTIDKEKITLSENITSKSIATIPKQLLCSMNSCSDSVTEVVFKVESKDVSSIVTKNEDIIGSKTNEENKGRCDGIIVEDTNSEHSALEKEQNVSTIDKEKITISEKITSKLIATTPNQLLCIENSCSDSVTEVVFKGENKVMSNNSTNAEDMMNDVSQNLEIKFEEKNESLDSIKLIEDGKSSHSPVKSEKNVSVTCMEQKSSPENLATELRSTKGNQLLCSAYSDSNSDSEISPKDDKKGKFFSMYSDSESEDSLEKEENENVFISEHQTQGGDKMLLKHESKFLKDSQNTSTDLKTLPTVTDLNSKETDNKSNLESSLSALSNKKVELAHPNEDQEVQNQNFNVLKNLGDPCSDPIYENKVNKISTEMQDLSKNVDKDFDMSVLFEPNDDSRSNSFTTPTEEKCDNSVTEQLYKEFSKIIGDEDKESKPPEYVNENKVVETITPNLDNIIFREFSISLTNLESMLGCKPVEMLQDIDVSLSEWATLLVSQLSIRDELISTLHSYIEKLVQKGTTLEQDLDYQQIKITELKQQVKKKKKKHKHKSCQTDEKQLNSWKEYYEAYPHTYAQHFYQNNQWPVDYGAKDSSTNESSEELNKKENSVREQDDSNNKDQIDSDTKEITAEIKETTEKDIIQTKNISKSKSDSVVNSSDSGNKSDEIIETLIDEDKDKQSDETISQIGKEPNSKIGTEEDITESESHGWDSSKSISDQVVAAASQIVEGTGYVYDQESGLYYDYNSGYYYNAETGLYYDSNTGTYFYYDHTTQAYQFHSQATPETYENGPKIGNKRKIKSLEETHIPLKKKKCKMEDETNGEKEEGECSESEEFSDGLDGVYGLNELSNEESDEDIAKQVKDDVNEEVPISQSEVPPSLRLMVIQSEAKRVNVGSLHMVTVDGGTAGRESNNIVHLQDISVSKVHARFIFHSNGPSDFHYYVKDLGSNNGTFVNAIRLSEPRQESQEKELGHGWLLRLGQVTLKCHIHPGNLTCNECEPGLVAKTINKKKEGSGYKSVKSREKARKKEMKNLKKKYALSYTDQSASLSSEYKDRAENRRLVVGSDNPYEKTEVASTEIALTNRNKGFKMLEKMGWTEGHGIGKTTGLIEPIQPESSVGRSGLGSTLFPIPETTPDQANRKKILGITQNRFNKL